MKCIVIIIIFVKLYNVKLMTLSSMNAIVSHSVFDSEDGWTHPILRVVCCETCVHQCVGCECWPHTFKEDEPAVVSLIGSIYVSRQPPPEVTDGHWVVIQNPVPADPPEPTALRGQN